MTDVVIDVAGEILHLLPERAVYWKKTATLLIADTHLGKTDTFRAHGIRIPHCDTYDDLQRLHDALQRTGAKRLVILGDLLHAKKGRDASMFATFAEWRNAHDDIEMILVRGNHDIRAGDVPNNWHIVNVSPSLIEAPFVMTHQPQSSDEGFVVCGHVHPAAQVIGQGRQRLKLPCFWLSKTRLILPAFGSFIDHAFIQPARDDQLWVTTGS